MDDVTPTPTDDEVAAMVAAVEVLWPRPVVAAQSPPTEPSPWRFSGRWWHQPLPLRRARPW